MGQPRFSHAAGVLIAVAAVACAHGGEMTPPAGAAEPGTGEVRETTATDDAPGSAAPSAPSQAAGSGDDRIENRMPDHFWAVTMARDAIMSGDLEAVRMPMSALASFRYDDTEPGGWLAWVLRIQQTAHATSEAATFELAATGVASMAIECGDCHDKSGGAPEFLRVIGRAPRTDPFAERMQGHSWAVDRMWEGLIAPSDEAWKQGAAELAAISRQAVDPDLGDEAFLAMLDEIRTLSSQAREATTPARRAQTYARVLSNCANCHRRAWADRY